MFVGFLAETRHLQQLLAALETAVFVTVFHYVACYLRTYAADVRKQLLAGGVEFYADCIDAALYDMAELFVKKLLVYVVLILSDADRLRIDLDQFGERIHEAAADAHSASHSDVIFWELVASDF